MTRHSLYYKLSKCSFVTIKVEYLRHFISEKGVETDRTKISAPNYRPSPATVKELRSFMGLSGYYRRFVKENVVMSKPLTELLKKGAFEWIETSHKAFIQLKEALYSASVLVVLDFSKMFVVETDASNYGIGVVLMWEQYLISAHFIINIDQNSLGWLLQ
ncbi:uncharacterized protein LOC110694813 [Chenopodium quinoa]|uniref:uncharacterized protein LOC110694813 n=1 Tax=Chenopodium quinoa TaxID=63459 RepID=UPI000B79592B|nr:uncharacterized protein LOC110694813 [Chenopodium quinoa]